MDARVIGKEVVLRQLVVTNAKPLLNYLICKRSTFQHRVQTATYIRQQRTIDRFDLLRDRGRSSKNNILDPKTFTVEDVTDY